MQILDDIEKYTSIIEDAKMNGLDGFGGHCFKVALLIKELLIPEGEIVGFVNKAFYDNGIIIGHFVVHSNGYFYDIDGFPKSQELVEYWGVLDYHDSYYSELANKISVDWTEEITEEVLKVFLTREEIYQIIEDKELLDEYRNILMDSKEDIENHFNI